MKKLVLGIALAGMITPVIASGSVYDYSLVVVLESASTTYLMTSLGSTEGSAVLSEIPIRKMASYDYKANNIKEIHLTSSCVKTDSAINVKPSQKPVYANLKVNGDWNIEGKVASDFSVGGDFVVVSNFSIDLRDISAVHDLGDIGSDCVAQSTTSQVTTAEGTFVLEPGQNEQAKFNLGSGYSLIFELKGK